MIRDQLQRRGIRDARVLEAMNSVPREAFVPEPLREMAYEDRALALPHDQTISQPYIVAYMTEKLDVQADHRVLEIGTGSGYQTAVLSHLCNGVFTVESVQALSQVAQETLSKLRIENIQYRVADGTSGWSEHAPFDRIIVTAAAPEVPEPLTAQLALNGKLILPVGNRQEQRLTLAHKSDRGVHQSSLIGCRFVPLIGKYGW